MDSHFRSSEATVPQGALGIAEGGSWELDVWSSCPEGQWCQGCVRRKKPPLFSVPPFVRGKGLVRLQGEPRTPHNLRGLSGLLNVEVNCCLQD